MYPSALPTVKCSVEFERILKPEQGQKSAKVYQQFELDKVLV